MLIKMEESMFDIPPRQAGQDTMATRGPARNVVDFCHVDRELLQPLTTSNLASISMRVRVHWSQDPLHSFTQTTARMFCPRNRIVCPPSVGWSPCRQYITPADTNISNRWCITYAVLELSFGFTATRSRSDRCPWKLLTVHNDLGSSLFERNRAM